MQTYIYLQTVCTIYPNEDTIYIELNLDDIEHQNKDIPN